VAAFWVAPDEVVLGVQDPPQIKVWNVKDKVAATFPLKSSGGRVWFGYLAQTRIVVAAVHDPATTVTTVTRWDVVTRRELSSCIADIGPTGGLQDRISRDGGSMVRYGDIGATQMLNLVTGEGGDAFTVRKTPIQGLALSPDGKSFVSAGTDSPEINVWDAVTEQMKTSLHGHNLVLLHLAYSPDGQRMMSASIGTEPIKMWETEGWQQLSSLTGRSGDSLGSPRMLSDGNTIVAQELELRTGNRRMRVWQSSGWEEIKAAEAAREPDRNTR
jgi:WD40 repeat protein